MIIDSLITLVMPVYNTPCEALHIMFDSIYGQVDQNFELLIINDGSNEATVETINIEKKRIGKGTLISQLNAGVSSARNRGIKECKTPYIAFVDADDVLDNNFILEANQYLKDYKPDILVGSMQYIEAGVTSDIIQSSSDGKINIFDSEKIDEAKKTLLDVHPRKTDYIILGTPCAKCYKTDMARKTLFCENIHFYEDQIFNRMMFNISKRIVVVPGTWYYYIQNEFSAMHNARNKRFYEGILPFLDKTNELDKNEDKEVRNALSVKYIDYIYGILKYDYIYKKISYKEAKAKFEEQLEHPIFKFLLEEYVPQKEHCMRRIDEMNLRLLKWKKYSLLYFEKKIVFHLKEH